MSEWFDLAGRVRVFAIYGNHDNIQLLSGVVNSDGRKALIEDGGIRVIGGLRFGFVSGIVSETKPMKQGVPRKTAREYVQAASRFSNVKTTRREAAMQVLGLSECLSFSASFM